MVSGCRGMGRWEVRTWWNCNATMRQQEGPVQRDCSRVGGCRDVCCTLPARRTPYPGQAARRAWANQLASAGSRREVTSALPHFGQLQKDAVGGRMWGMMTPRRASSRPHRDSTLAGLWQETVG